MLISTVLLFSSLFKHLTYALGGCRHVSHVSKLTSGPTSFALQYGNSTSPNAKKIDDDEMWSV